MDKLLIVEDSPIFYRLLRHALESKFGCRGIIAENLAQAQSLLENNSTDYFAAILDMELPDAPHGEIIDYVVSKNIPSLVYTGKFTEKQRAEILNKNIVDYILKDNVNSVQELVSALERMKKNSRTKILIVDDDQVSLSIIRRNLEIHQFIVYSACSGKEALEVINENPDIRLLITDYAMPEMDGFRLVEEIRKLRGKESLAIIGISGQEKDTLSAQFLKIGANDYLGKPFSREELYCRVVHNIEMLEKIEELEELNTSKDRFLGMAAHDLRSPLSGIKGFSEMILNEMAGPLTSEQREYMELINDTGSGLLQLVNDLLDVNAISRGKLELDFRNTDLKELVRKNIHKQELIAGQKNIAISRALSDLPEIMIDPDKINQVLDNLISNAIKFSPREKNIRVRLEQEAEKAVIRIQDQGPGISSEEQDQLFREFYKGRARPTDNEGSTGLGLAIVKRIVDAHRGRIKIESIPGHGSEFVVYLPMTNVDHPEKIKT